MMHKASSLIPRQAIYMFKVTKAEPFTPCVRTLVRTPRLWVTAVAAILTASVLTLKFAALVALL
jgi:hypothetical protein